MNPQLSPKSFRDLRELERCGYTFKEIWSALKTSRPLMHLLAGDPLDIIRFFPSWKAKLTQEELIPHLQQSSPSDYPIRQQILSRLEAFGPEAYLAIPALFEACQQENFQNWPEEYRYLREENYIKTLLELGRHRKALPYLLQGLEPHQPEEILFITLKTLLALKRNIQSAFPALLHLLEKSQDKIRSEVVLVLGKRGKSEKNLCPLLLQKLENSPLPLQCAILEILFHLAPQIEEAVPYFLRLLQNSQIPTYLHLNMIQLLGLIGHSASSAIPLLLQQIQEKNESRTLEILQALSKIDASHPEVQQILQKKLFHLNKRIRYCCARILISNENTFHQAFPILLQSLQENNDYLRRDTLRALKILSPKKLFPFRLELLQLLEQSSPMVQKEVLVLLRKEPGTLQNISSLLYPLLDPQHPLAFEVAEILFDLETHHSPLQKFLQKIQKDKCPRLQKKWSSLLQKYPERLLGFS